MTEYTRRTLRLAAGVAVAFCLFAIPMADRVSAKPPADILEVAVLTPRDGVALNAATLDIQALASARRAGRSDDDVWTGWMRVDLAIDGVLTQSLDPTICRGQIVAGFRASLTSLAPGSHVATITASKKTRGSLVQGSASLAFTIDPALPVRETNRVEAAATPTPFACLSTPDVDPDDDGRADDYDGRFATLRGSFVPNALSSGLDLTRDRVVIAIDDQLVVIEPGSFVCRAHNRCRFTDNRGGLVRSVRLEQKKRGRWTFTIATRHRPWFTRSLFLRIGANWGGLDYVHDQYVAALTPALDAAHRATATIGPAGGTVQTTDAAGVVIRLIVPPDALTRDTPITATPLAAAALVGQAADLHFGVNFEPEGLVFEQAARLELDFGTATRALTDHDFIYLVTSPLTRVPLVNNAQAAGTILTASLSHFSTVAASGLAPLFGNLVDWDPRLTSAGALTFTELASLAEVVRVQLAMGCTLGPECAAVDAAFARLTADVSDSITALLPSCTADVVSPTRAAFDHWITVMGLAGGLGLDSSSIRGCAENVLNALVNKAGVDGLANPRDAAVQSLDDLETLALGLSFSTAASNAHGKKHDVLSKVIDLAGATAAGDPSVANLARMIGLKAKAQGFVFADLERRVLEKSVAAARAAIARLQTSCDANPTAPATDVAKELARTWVAFVNQDPTVAPTLSPDFRQVADNCGGVFKLVIKGQSTFAYAEDETANADTLNRLPGDTSPPVSLAAAAGVSAMGFTLSKVSDASGEHIVTWDVTASAGGDGAASGGVSSDITFAKGGTLSFEVNPAWGGGGRYNLSIQLGSSYCSRVPAGSLACVGSFVTGLPNGVSTGVQAGTTTLFLNLRVIDFRGYTPTGSGLVFTMKYTPSP